MEPLPGCNIKYLNISRNDEAWGLVVTTAGIPPNVRTTR